MSLRIATLALALGLAPGLALAQVTPPLLPHEVGAAEAWKVFRKHPIDHDFEQQMERLSNMLGEDGEVAAEACNPEELRELEQKLPISLAVWWLQNECAERSGDEAAAERSLKAFAALARHALENSPRRHSDEAPVPILSELDLWFLIRGLEMEVGYVYLDMLSSGPHAPFLVSLWDPVEQREHLLSLDMIDVLMDLIESAGEPRSLPARIALENMLMEGSAEHSADMPNPRAVQLMRAMQAHPAERNQRLLALAIEGDFHAALRLFGICRTNPDARCGTQTVDALLPFAESGLAEALSMLGSAHALGLGMRRDARAAADLYARADARLGGYEASLASARSWLQPPLWGAIPKPLKQRLERAAKEGHAEAHDLLLLNQIAVSLKDGPARRIPRKLEAAAVSSSTWVRAGYGSALLQADPDRAWDHLIEGARLGGYGQTLLLLSAMYASDHQPLDEVELLQFHERAGYGGRTDSALWVGRHYRAQQQPEVALRWLLGAALLGSTQGYLESATLIVQRWKGENTLAMAAGLLEQVLKREDNAEAEVLLADLLLRGQGGVEADRPRAAQLLRTHHAKGDAHASELLAINLLNGNIKAQAGESARAMLEQAAASGNADAMSTLALLIYSGDLEGEPETAIDWWQKAIDAGLPAARNNRAWCQCVSTDSRIHNPEAGLADALQMGEAATLPITFRGTLATCHAAVGDFEQAIELLRGIVEEQVALDLAAEARTYYINKLAMFERGEVFRESPETHRLNPTAHQ